MNRRTFLHAGSTGTFALAAGTLWPGTARAASGGLDDVEIVRRALDLHPGLYRYNTPRGFAAKLDDFARNWAARPDRASRFLALSRLTAEVRCGHTQCNPFNQSDTVVAELFDRPTRVPFRFVWIGEEMVVTGDSGATTGIECGSVVERLNGQRPAAIQHSLLRYARADGSNDAKRRVQMEMRGDEQFETFDIFQGLLFPPGPEGHRVTWRDPAGRRHSAVLPAISYATRKALLPPEPAGDQPLWDWRIDQAGIAILTMPSWVTYHGKWNWQGWLKDRFASLGGAKGLVIDLRRNEGGTDCGTLILQHLISRTVYPMPYATRVRFREAPAQLLPYLDTWDRSFRTLGRNGRDAGGGFFDLPSDDDETEFAAIKPLPPQIQVPVAVLMGPVNSSATFSFVRRVRETGAARLFGGPSGGNLRGINGGAMFFVRLPESGLEFDLPLKGFFPRLAQPDAAVQPHVRIIPSAADIAALRDPELAAARSWILG
ncbi:S41 family peptidase [Novosphingobium sp.]|uniref:S41 family peptidase n=1 Tax=Novosphingobium sp. TaxID=1874826 RepID=UPI0025F1AF48|nr:S41 family peptidase [Novosphingobium sp.]MCC6925068.1 peptidase S41 [Novosphingobium sp.]